MRLETRPGLTVGFISVNSSSNNVSLERFLVFAYEYSVLTKFIYHIWICIALFGLVSNTINVVVFMKMGLKDNVTITLLFLSISDLLNITINSLTIAGRYMEVAQPRHIWPFNRFIIILGPYWYAYIFYDYSSFISVFLATVRCACVARPLRFKSMFTKSRTVTILCLLFILAFILRVPVITVFRLIWAVNPQTNTTYRSIELAGNFRDIYQANDILNRNIISWLAYITITMCVIILASKLQSASRFRQSLTSQATNNGESEKNSKVCPISESQGGPTEVSKSINHNVKHSDKMSARDLQVIKSVTLICVIFILSQLPFQVVSTVRLFVPEFANFRSAQYIYSFASHISNTCGYLNASVNIFVHIRFNTRYRARLLALISLKFA